MGRVFAGFFAFGHTRSVGRAMDLSPHKVWAKGHQGCCVAEVYMCVRVWEGGSGMWVKCEESV